MPIGQVTTRLTTKPAFLENVVHQMPSGVIIVEAPSGRLLLGSDEVERIWRRPFAPSAERDGYAAWPAFHPDGRPYRPGEWPMARSLATGEVVHGETIRIERGDGTWGVIDVSAAPIRDAEGRVIAAVSTFSDVTERHQIQASARFLSESSEILASSLDYETTLASVADLAVPWLADWCAIDMLEPDGSPRRLAVTHVDPAKVSLAREIQERFPPDPDAPTGVPNVLRTGEPELYPDIPDELLAAAVRSPEELAVARDLGLASAIIVPLKARGHTHGAITFATAESGRRYGTVELELALALAARAGLAVDNARLYRRAQEAEAQYRAVIEGAGDAICVVDLQGRVIDANPAAVRLLGYSVDELRALPPGRLAISGQAWVEEQRRQLLASGEWRGEVEVRRKDGSIVPIESHVTRLDSPTGPVLVSTARDISERRAGERMQREFAAMVGHELKNPLAALSGFAQLMRRRGSYSRRAVDSIVEQVGRLDRIVGDLLDVSRLEAGRLELVRAPVDLVELVRGCVERAKALGSGRVPTVEAEAAQIVGAWDQGRLEQVLDNLLSNAAKYSPSGTPIVVRVERTGSQARVSVSDHGPGIPAAALPRLFRRFSRLEGTESQAPGLGLGLYICRTLVEAHGGRIWAESRPSQGATFIFVLPLDPASTDGRAMDDMKGDLP